MTTISQIAGIASDLTGEVLFEIEQDGVSKQVDKDVIKDYMGGSGTPAGGTTGQSLTKNSGVDGDASWKRIGYKNYSFSPLISAPTVFTADDASSIVTPTTLSSTNSGSPVIFGIPFAMMTGTATGGEISIVPPTDDLLVYMVYHDGTINEGNAGTVISAPNQAAIGAIVKVEDTLITVTAGGTSNNITPSSPTLIQISGTQIITEAGTKALNSVLFPYCSVFILNPVTSVVGTVTFTNDLVGQSVAPIPVDAIDGDALIIGGLGAGQSVTLLGSSVINDDYCVLIDNKTAIRVIRDEDVEAQIADSLNNGSLQIVPQNVDIVLSTTIIDNQFSATKPALDITLTASEVGANQFQYDLPASFKKARMTVVNQTKDEILGNIVSFVLPIAGGADISEDISTNINFLLDLTERTAPFTTRVYELVNNGSIVSVTTKDSVACSLVRPKIILSLCEQVTPATLNIPLALNSGVLSFKVDFNPTYAREGMRLRLVALDNITPINLFNNGTPSNVVDYFLTATDIVNGYAIITANPTEVQANLTDLAGSVTLNINTYLAYQQPVNSMQYKAGLGLHAQDDTIYTVTVT